jgi:ketosteroid isomerase-like protein
MYKAAVRGLVRHGIGRLNSGDPRFLLRLAAVDAEIAFPGDNSWAAMQRPVEKGRHRHATHRGLDECRSFAQRFASEGIQIVIEDILVNGPPWNTRVAVRAHDYIPGDNADVYNNRVVAFMEIKWGRLHTWEDYEDTQRVSAWDDAREAASSKPAGTLDSPLKTTQDRATEASA